MLSAGSLRWLARRPTVVAVADAIADEVQVTEGDWWRLYPDNAAQLWAFMGFVLRRQRQHGVFMSVAERSWRNGPALRAEVGGIQKKRRYLLGRMVKKAVDKWSTWRAFEAVVDAAVRRLDELRSSGPQLGGEPEAGLGVGNAGFAGGTPPGGTA